MTLKENKDIEEEALVCMIWFCSQPTIYIYIYSVKYNDDKSAVYVA